MRRVLARTFFRLGYWAAPEGYHGRLFCLPAEHIGRALVKDGWYEQSLIQIIKRHVENTYPGATVRLIDVGANIGTHTVALAGLCVTVVAFEPNPIVAAALRLNLRVNGITNVRVLELAASAVAGKRRLAVPADNFGNASLDVDTDRRETYEVETTTLDIQMAASLGENDIPIIKIDVEGHEYEVLQGAAQILSNHRCVVILEFNRSDSSQAMIRYLAEKDYEPSFQIDIPRLRTRPFYRLLSFLGAREEAKIGPFRPQMAYVPAVVFSKKDSR